MNAGASAASVFITSAEGPEDMARVRGLFTDYVSWLGEWLDFQGFSEEICSLPGKYAPPRGGLLLAHCANPLPGAIFLERDLV